jgi:hypothetical protein
MTSAEGSAFTERRVGREPRFDVTNVFGGGSMGEPRQGFRLTDCPQGIREAV